MKPFLLLLLVVSFFNAPLYAYDMEADALAQSYTKAAHAQDEAALRKLLPPTYLSGLDENGKKYVEMWVKMALKDGPRLAEPIHSRSTALGTDAPILKNPLFTWKVKPELQIEMQPYTEVNGEQKPGNFVAVQFAAKSGGKLYFVVPFPAEQKAAK